jgi:actin-related protein 6
LASSGAYTLKPRFPRIDIGGKLLTNHLKEVISYRHYNMMSETFIVNEIKEACCFVSRSFASDLELCR